MPVRNRGRPVSRTMFWKWYISYFTVLSLFVVVTEGVQCPYQECYCAGPVINCDDRSLHTIPALLVKNSTFFESLIFDDNLISTVPCGSLPSNLRDLSFESNPITTIDMTAFDDSANTLESLSFDGANFSKLPDAFYHLRTLKYLSIVNSHVVDWNPSVMKSIGATLQTLTLDNVGFTTWPVWIQYFSQLTQLSISTSSISAIPDDGLERLWDKLLRLTLNNNKLTEVPKTLSNMSALHMLTFDNNNIVNITWLPRTSKITFLSLSSNNIADGFLLSSALKYYEGSLTDLYVSDNKLTYIPDLSFLTLVVDFNFTDNQIFDPFSGTLPPYVKDIYLGHNLFSLIPRLFWSTNSVSDIVMPFNKITMVDEMHIPPWTTALELDFNYVTELTDTSFPTDSNLSFVRLSNNPIAKISNLAFVNLPRLVEMDLQNTKLTRLPLALGSLKGIVMIDVSGTRDLVCTCVENSLRPWILSQSSENIVGNCGLLSVYDFFQYLSSGCPEKLSHL